MKIHVAHRLLLISICSALIFTAPISANAQSCATAGCPDDTFGLFGQVLTNLNFQTGTSYAYAIVIQPADGKILVAATGMNYPAPDAGQDLYVLRYYPDGSLDYSFGVGGVSRISFTAANDRELTRAIGLQSDGKIVVGGFVPAGFGIVRLDANGTIDNSFGTNGKVSFNFSGHDVASLWDLQIQTNDRIVVAGSSDNSFAVARLTANGDLDTTFNGTGKVTVSTATGNDFGGANALAIQPDGKIVVAGRRPLHKKISRDFAVMRFNSNGTLDSTFGSSGKVFTDFSGSGDSANDVAIDGAGKIVVVGTVGTSGGSRYGIARYNTNGLLDTTFGAGGKVSGGTGYQVLCEGVVIQNDGKIVLAGSRQVTSTLETNDFLIARFNSNGSPDTSFGAGGSTLSDFGANASDQALALAIQSDGKLVVGGLSNRAWYIALARYLP